MDLIRIAGLTLFLRSFFASVFTIHHDGTTSCPWELTRWRFGVEQDRDWSNSVDEAENRMRARVAARAARQASVLAYDHAGRVIRA